MASKIFVKGYQVGALMEQSGLRSVYRAMHLSSQREVFLTVISVRPGRCLSALERRAEMSKKLSFPGLVGALEWGVLPNDKFFFTQRATPSLPIKRVLAEIPDFTSRLYAALRYFSEVLAIVDYVHAAGTTHRNLQSAMVRIGEGGSALLEGFINARPKVESPHMAHIVTLPYMSPEQLTGEAKADKKTDIYSLGVILFELISAKLPYTSNEAKLQDFRRGGLPSFKALPIEVPCDIQASVLKALAPRDCRYRSVREFSREIQNFYNQRPLLHKLKEAPYHLRRLLSKTITRVEKLKIIP